MRRGIYQAFKKHVILRLSKRFQRKGRKGRYPDTLCQVSITVAPRANRIHRRKNLSTVSFININGKKHEQVEWNRALRTYCMTVRVYLKNKD